MNGYLGRFLSIILFLFLAGYTGYQAYRYLYKPYNTERAINYTITDSLRVKGIVVRDETAFKNASPGVLSFTEADSDKVTTNTVIGHIYSDFEQASAVQHVKELENEISSLNQITESGALIYANAELLTSQINEKLGKLTVLSATGNAGGVTGLRSDLQTLLNKKNVITGSESNFSERIGQLEAQKQQLEAQAGSSFGTLQAPESGYFTRYCDGQEANLNLDKILKMSNDEISQLIAGKYNRDEAFTGKIVRDHNWYFCTIVNKRESEKLKVGSTVYLNFPSKRIIGLPATVQTVELNDGKVKVILTCDFISPYLLSLRSSSAEISFQTYSGLRVNSQAVRMIDGQAGVYVKTGYNIQFRPINIIYQENDFVICGPMQEGALQKNTVTSSKQQTKETTDGAKSKVSAEAELIENKPLELFDEVIVGGTDLYDGKPLV